MSRTARLARYGTVSSRLTSLSDPELAALLDEAAVAGVGIGGTTASLTVDGVPVFVKRVPLTDLERRPEHAGSTANLFQLPMFYQYGIGSAGFGAWREVAAHTMTTDWVLENRFQGFPILYHWRVLPQPPAPIEPAELERWVAHWEGSPAVRDRFTAIAESSAGVVLFMEHIPYTVHTWLTAQTAAGDGAAASAYTLVDRGLQAGVAFMGSQDLLHFDAHFHNLLTDGHRLYFADFGLATSSRFDLSGTESDFFRQHLSYDRCYTATHLAHWLVCTLLDIPWADCHEYIRDNADGRGYADLPAPAAGIVARHAPVATVMGEFYGALQTASKLTPYPTEDLRRALFTDPRDGLPDRPSVRRSARRRVPAPRLPRGEVMKAIARDVYGPAGVLELRDIDKPPIGADEVLVEVRAAGVDPGVWILMTGRPMAVRLAVGLRRPKVAVLGRAVAGVVAAVGAGVTRLRQGDEVYGTCESGSFAEYATARQHRLAPKPANLTFEQAAATPISAVTALQSVRDARVQPGQRVLITGAAGGVGSFAVQLVNGYGASVTGVCSTSKVELVRSLGAEDVIDYTQHEIDRGGAQYDVIIDTAGNRPLSLLRRALTPRGTIALVGGGHAKGWLLGGFQRQLAAPLLSLFGGQRVCGVTGRERYEDLEELTPLIESGSVTPVIDRTYALADAPDAIRYLAEGHPAGKVVVTVKA